METDPTQLGIAGQKHPTLAELRNPSQPSISQHLASCSMCRSVVSADGTGANEPSVPIQLDLPKGLVNENAFKWPADPLARGGMAEIYAGEDRRLGRTVILKAPRQGDELQAGMADMFQRRVTAEARILAKLQHPSIVTIHELGKSTVGWPFCVLERVEGTALRDRLDELWTAERDGVPRTRERLELLSNVVAIAEALAYAHERRIVHRDCTPNNILLGKRGEATLIDWGIARDLDAPGDHEDAQALNDQPPSMSGRMVTISAGTPPYLPLEQSQGRAADPSFDVYSFGVTLYEIVSGTTPFEWKAVDGAHRNKQLLDFLDWLKEGQVIPPAMPKDPELSGIIARAMAHDRAQRFTADELVRALKQYLTGDLVFSHRYSRIGRLARWARQHKAVTVALSSLVVFVIAGALVWAQLSRAAREEAELREAKATAESNAMLSGQEADEATRLASEAKAAAEDAERRGSNATQAKQRAEEAKQRADRMRAKALADKKQAEGTADDARRGFKEAVKQREAAELSREAAVRAQVESERLRDLSLKAQQDAERSRDVAQKAQATAERSAEQARVARETAERERVEAQRAQADAEKQPRDMPGGRGRQGRDERAW
ncbi:MAG: protein kinase, partial [Kofleriaceae bacterium]